MAAFFGFPNSVIMSEVSLTKRVTTQSKDPAFVCSQHCRGREFSPRATEIVRMPLCARDG
jgi:hypothetical protein